MYPPQEDARVKCAERPSLRKYRNKGHYDFVGLNGSIRIESLDAETLLDKAGLDGKRTSWMSDRVVRGKCRQRHHLDVCSRPTILHMCNMETTIDTLQRLLTEKLPRSRIKVDELTTLGGVIGLM